VQEMCQEPLPASSLYRCACEMFTTTRHNAAVACHQPRLPWPFHHLGPLFFVNQGERPPWALFIYQGGHTPNRLTLHNFMCSTTQSSHPDCRGPEAKPHR
jgi:hypothetical protein